MQLAPRKNTTTTGKITLSTTEGNEYHSEGLNEEVNE